MLVNGEEVNNLILGGETFVSQSKFPGKFTFGKSSVDAYLYDVSIDSNSRVGFVPLGHKDANGPTYKSSATIASQSIVYQEKISKGEKYILVRSADRAIVNGWIHDDIVWVKLADLGGTMTPIK